MKLYLCGPMTGVEDNNRKAFCAAAAELAAAGFVVHNPAVEEEGLAWEVYMRLGLREMLTCNGVAVLDGGIRNSAGAALEVYVADRVGIKILSVKKWLERAR